MISPATNWIHPFAASIVLIVSVLSKLLKIQISEFLETIELMTSIFVLIGWSNVPKPPVISALSRTGVSRWYPSLSSPVTLPETFNSIFSVALIVPKLKFPTSSLISFPDISLIVVSLACKSIVSLAFNFSTCKSSFWFM